MAYRIIVDDYLTEKGAHSLSVKIRDYWLRRGVKINVWVEAGSYSGNGQKGPSFWVVRSNINMAVLRDPDPALR